MSRNHHRGLPSRATVTTSDAAQSARKNRSARPSGERSTRLPISRRDSRTNHPPTVAKKSPAYASSSALISAVPWSTRSWKRMSNESPASVWRNDT